jgi:hypothetical protein
MSCSFFKIYIEDMGENTGENPGRKMKYKEYALKIQSPNSQRQLLIISAQCFNAAESPFATSCVVLAFLTTDFFLLNL